MPATSDWTALFPFDSHYLDLGEYRYHYLDEGRGDVLLLVHGNPTWSFYWRNLIQAFRDRYRIIAVDHLGCGLSEKPRNYPYRLADHIGNLQKLLHQLDLADITLIAHDWGGAIGLGAAVEEPDRFARFIMCNTAAFRGGRMPWRIRVCRTPLFGRLAVQGMNAFARAALTMAVCHHDRITAEVRSGLLAPYDSWANRQAIYHFVRDIPLSPRHPSYRTLLNIETRLPALADRPWQFLWGMRDWCFTPRFLDRFLEFFPQAEAHRFYDAGHYVVEDAYERIVPLVESFLATHPLSPAKANLQCPT